jgi:hypothetical protein
MAYGLQKRVQAELDSRIPRGPKGSYQNFFRQHFSVHRLIGDSFELSADKALAEVRKLDPGFMPRILPLA